MKISIKNKKENILLSRFEIEAEIYFENQATPSSENVNKELAKALSVDKDLLIVRNIYTTYGDSRAKVLAFQYLSKDELHRIESIEMKQEEQKEEKKQEAKKEEKSDEKKEVASARETENQQKEAPKEEQKSEKSE